ncbi:MAG: protoglobin domain-containing protein [Byssovorax sp.]
MNAPPPSPPAPTSPETLFEEMKRYIRFEPEDEARIAALRPLVAPHFPRIADEFYDRIREHEEAHAVFTGEPQINRLRDSMVRWMERLCAGPYDQSYYDETAKIGRMHVRIGLPQRYMFTAMTLIRSALATIAEDALGPASRPMREALHRVLDLDLAIMMEAYRDAYAARVQHVEQLERHEAYRTLRRTEHRYVNAVELGKMLIIGLDARGLIRMFNREAERVTGYGRDEVIGRSFQATLSETSRFGVDGSLSPPSLDTGPVSRDDEQSLIIAAAAAGSAIVNDVIEGVIRVRTGKLRDVRWQLAHAPSHGEAEEVVLFLFGRDTTDENALAARQRQNEKLAAVGTLAAGLAHEIRNPLNGAQLHVTFLERSLRKAGVDAEARDAVRVVGDEIQRLSALVTEFLDFARPNPLERRTVSLRALCDHVMQLMSPVAAAAKVDLTCEHPASDLLIEVDPSKLEQVLLNLLQNAIEAVEPLGGGKVIARARRRPRNVVLEIEDDGPGLPSHDAPIFDPFFSTKPSGTGLGLAIVHRIVTDHDGSIDVESKPGRTVFRIILPIRSPLIHEVTGRR